MSDNNTGGLIREVAAPGSVFWEIYEHPENVEILEGDPNRTRKLPRDKHRLLTKKLRLLESAYQEYLRAWLDHLHKRAESLRSVLMLAQQLDRLPLLRSRLIPALAKAALAVDQLESRIAEVESRIDRRVKHIRRNPHRVTSPDRARAVATMIHRIEARLDEHKAALENERIVDRLRAEMRSEAAYFWQQIVDRWSYLGFKETYTVEGKVYVKRVLCAEAHYMEDEIQYKILVSSLNVFGSTVHHLPGMVRAWDLVKEETLRELSVACEVPVTSPHVTENLDFDHGAWIIVHRVGMRHGLFNYIALETVLAKYNQALRPKFAIPMGVKTGRIIEYLLFESTPHLLIDGITGSGKTNLERVILTVLVQFYSTAEARLVLVDLKRGGDLNRFASVPHMIGDVVKDMAVLAALTPKLKSEMNRRADLISAANEYDIRGYNRKVAPVDRLARIFVIIDEAAAINDAAESRRQRDGIWSDLSGIAMRARSAGIHLIICSQQPGVKIIPPAITNNIPYSVSGRQRTASGAMQSSGDLRNRDLGNVIGRMNIDNGNATIAVQTPEATDASITRALQVAANYPALPFHLPGDVEEDTAQIAAVESAVEEVFAVTRERVIAISLDFFDGVMNYQKIYEHTGKVTPSRQISDMIKDIVREGVITFEGEDYKVVPKGKGYKLTRKTAATGGDPAADTTAGADDTNAVIESEAQT